MLKGISLLSVVSLLLLGACGNVEEVVVEEAKPVSAQFTPNQEGRVMREQLIRWNAAHEGLRAIASIYTDELAESPDEATSYQISRSYETARDSVATVAGLVGGYREYEWITKNVANTINRPLLDSLGLR